MSEGAAKRQAVPTRLVLIEDHQILREGLAALLGADPRFSVSGQASTAAEAMVLVRDTSPDLAIVDVALNADDGVALARQLRYAHSDLRIVMLSMYDDRATVERARRAGALGYVLKGGGLAQLSEAIVAAMQDREWLDPKLPAIGAASSEQVVDTLSLREVSVVRLVARGMTSKEIAADLGLATKTVQNHRARILEKLGVGSTAALVRYALANGLE